MSFLGSGICSAGGWHKYNARKFALKCYENKTNLVVIELFAPTYPTNSGSSQVKISPSVIVDKFLTFAKPLNELNISILIHFINMGDDTNHLYTIPEFSLIYSKINKSRLNILVPMAERRDGQEDLERTLFDITRSWIGPRAYNDTGRASSCPYSNVQFLDWHPQGTSNLPQQRVLPYIIDTDCYPTIRELMNGARAGQTFARAPINQFARQCAAKPYINYLSIYSVDDSGDFNRFSDGMAELGQFNKFKKNKLNYIKWKYFHKLLGE